tara:strand:+ start:1048 stop:2337 length:1290 start_codon:yes stop_codon:yes gene_type:complete
MSNEKYQYKFKWYYKTNYSGSKYFPLKISNVELLSESDKYSQIDRFDVLKKGDVVKYNNPSHPNNGLLAKIISEDKNKNDSQRNYADANDRFDRYNMNRPREPRLINRYTIEFEPFENYIEAIELEDYQNKYENMINTIENVSKNDLLKFRYVEKDGSYSEDFKNVLKDPAEINKIISDNTLAKLKKNTKFLPDYILAKYQPESGEKDMQKLIKPNNKHVYVISHSPVIKKRPSDLYFDYKIKKIDDNVKTVLIEIYVDLLLFQSKSISEEEWNNTPLTGKISSILSEQVRNSYAGVFNCPSRFDKLKIIVNNIKNGKFVVDPEESETNLIKQTFNKTSNDIKDLKNKIKKKEEEKEKIIKSIKGKIDEDEKIENQMKLGELDQKISDLKSKILKKEAILKQKGGRKTKKHKHKHKKRGTTKKSKNRKR